MERWKQAMHKLVAAVSNAGGLGVIGAALLECQAFQSRLSKRVTSH